MALRAASGGMIQESEIVTLILGLIAAPGAYRLHRAGALPRAAFAGVALLVCAYVFTVLEGFVFHDLFNALEHVALAGAGVGFAAGTLRLLRRGAEPDAA